MCARCQRRRLGFAGLLLVATALLPHSSKGFAPGRQWTGLRSPAFIARVAVVESIHRLLPSQKRQGHHVCNPMAADGRGTARDQWRCLALLDAKRSKGGDEEIEQTDDGDKGRGDGAGKNSKKRSHRRLERSLEKLPETDKPIPFVEVDGNNFIECYADSVATLEDGTEYTIGNPCDHAVALCYFDADDQLVPIELDDDLMDEVFPIVERIVEDEFGEDLALVRTPQTLTLVGELEEGGEEEEDDDETAGIDDDEEEVEVLLSFQHTKDVEVNLVRLLDPVLLVGKADKEDPSKRVLLTPEEAERVMPTLEEMFLEYHNEDEP